MKGEWKRLDNRRSSIKGAGEGDTGFRVGEGFSLKNHDKEVRMKLSQFTKSVTSTIDPILEDRIDGNRIILNADGYYPKEVAITDRFGRPIREYLFKKTRKGGYLLI